MVVDDAPRHLSQDNKSTHSLYFPDLDVRLPLQLKGVISYFNTRYPSQQEVDNCRWLVVTNDANWDPYDDSFAEQEQLVNEHEQTSHLPMSYDHHLYSLSPPKKLIWQPLSTVRVVPLQPQPLDTNCLSLMTALPKNFNAALKSPQGLVKSQRKRVFAV